MPTRAVFGFAPSAGCARGAGSRRDRCYFCHDAAVHHGVPTRHRLFRSFHPGPDRQPATPDAASKTILSQNTGLACVLRVCSTRTTVRTGCVREAGPRASGQGFDGLQRYCTDHLQSQGVAIRLNAQPAPTGKLGSRIVGSGSGRAFLVRHRAARFDGHDVTVL